MRTAIVAIVLSGFAGVAQAHAGAHAHGMPWTFDPWIIVPLLVSAALYGSGALRVTRRSRRLALHGRRIGCFCAGWLVLAIALVSPLHAAGEHSFAAHMLEHELLMLVGAPLLVLGRPLGFFAWALPLVLRRAGGSVERQSTFASAWRFLTHPVSATVVQGVALWGWHAPGPFDLALAHEGWHAVQHLSFLVSALLFWTAVLDGRRMDARPALAIGCLFATALIGGALGALMAFSWSPWYAAYAALGLTPFGLTPVQDQQLAGLLMWIPGGVIHAGAALAIALRVLRRQRDAPAAPDTAARGDEPAYAGSATSAPPG